MRRMTGPEDFVPSLNAMRYLIGKAFAWSQMSCRDGNLASRKSSSHVRDVAFFLEDLLRNLWNSLHSFKSLLLLADFETPSILAMHPVLAIGLLAPWLLAAAVPATKHDCKCVCVNAIRLQSIGGTDHHLAFHRLQTTSAGPSRINGTNSTPRSTANSSRRSPWRYPVILAPSKTPVNALSSTKDGQTLPSKQTIRSVSAIRST